MAHFVTVLQVITGLLLIILMAVQTEASEQGGVMGIGAAGGRSTSDVDMEVGPERILKPLTRWMGAGFIFCSILGAVPPDKISIVHLVVALVIYLVTMLYGGVVWAALTGTRR